MINDNQYNTLINSILGIAPSNSRHSFNKIDNKKDMRENEDEDDDEDELDEEDVWNDGSELSIEDFMATGEDLDDYEDEYEMEDEPLILNESDSLMIGNSILFMDDKNKSKSKNTKLDNVDEDGVPLNEKNIPSGKDLDVPGADLDDEEEEIGEEDEENNEYSNSKQND